MSTNDVAQDGKIIPFSKVKLQDSLGEYEIATLDVVKANVNNDSRFLRLKLTQGQQMQINGLMTQLPALFNMKTLPNTVRLTFPKGVQGSLMPLKNGGYSTTLRDGAGKIVGTASIDFPATFQTVALGAFTAMSIVSGQYFLAQINNKLGKIAAKLDEILEFLYGDKRAELLSEVNFIRSACKNYRSVMEHSEHRIATLVSLQSAEKVAMKDIEFYLSDLKSAIDSINKKNGDQITEKMIRTQECLEFSLKLYAMSNLLEIYYSENFDPNYIDFVKEEATKYIGVCEKRSLTCFGGLENFLNVAKNPVQIEKVKAILEEMNAKTPSPLQTELENKLEEISDEKQFYLTEGGEVYLWNAS